MSYEPGELDLLRQAVTGDRAALSQLLLLHYEDLQRHIAHQLASQPQTLLLQDDVLQETFVRAARGVTTFVPQGNGSFCAWLKTISGNLIRDAQKRHRRERRLPSHDRHAALSGSSAAAVIERIAGETTSPSRRAHRGDSVRQLRAALSGLSPEQREVVQRYYLKDETFEQIAAAMNRSKDSVRGICYRARKQLQDILGSSSRYFSG